MTTTFDNIFRQAAVDLIKVFGVTKGRYTVMSDPIMDDDTNTACPVENTKRMQMSPPVKYKRMDVDGTIIRSDDAKIYIAAPHWEAKFHKRVPRSSDVVEVSGQTFTVVNEVNPIYSGDKVAAYQLQVRKGHA